MAYVKVCVCIRVCVCVRQTTRRERDREAEREKECARAAPDWMESSMFVLELLAAYLDHMCSEFGSNRPNERHIVPQNCSVCTCAHGKQPARAEREREKADLEWQNSRWKSMSLVRQTRQFWCCGCWICHVHSCGCKLIFVCFMWAGESEESKVLFLRRLLWPYFCAERWNAWGYG